MTVQTQPETRFDHGARLTPARLIWLIITFASIGFCIVGIQAYYQMLVIDPFFGSTVQPGVNDFAAIHLGLARWGLTNTAYAAVLVAGQILNAIILSTLGAFIFWQRSERAAWTISLILVLLGTLAGSPAAALGKLYPAFYFLGFIGNQIGGASLIVLFWIFPDGHFVPSWSRWTLLLWSVFTGFVSLFPNFFLAPLLVFSLIVFLGLALVAQVYRYVRVSGPHERHQTKWVMFALFGGFLIWVIGAFLIPALFPALTQTSENVALYNLVRQTLNNFATLLIPLTIGFSILRYRLFDIDLIIRRTLQYSVLSGLLALTYFGLIVVLQGIFTAVSGQSSSVALVLSTLAIAGLFLPLRRRVQDFIDRRFFRKKYNAAKVVAEFAATCRDETDLDNLTARLVEVVGETMQPESVSLWLKDPTAKE